MSLADIPPDLDGIRADRLPAPGIYGESRSDAGNARRLVALYGDELLYVKQTDQWHIWDGRSWRPDHLDEIWQRAKTVARTIYEEAAREEDDTEARKLGNFALASQNRTRLAAMISLAASEPEIAVTPDQLDADPFLLTVANGTLNLQTGELKPFDPADRITKTSRVHYDPDAECPTWLSFLSEIYDHDQELVEFDRRWTGYCLTGDTREHAIRLDHGPSGRNGKSTHARVLMQLLGDYCRSADFSSFLRKRGEGPREDLARLAGARLVIANESGAHRRLDEATVKGLTGGDPVVARHLYGASFEFTPEHKIVLVSNSRPRIDGGDDALWTRLREVPYRVSFAGREDRELPAKLEQELSGILAWAVRGCLEWQENGLGTAAAIEEATREHREDEDTLGAFISDRLQEGGKIETKRLRQLYDAYCDEADQEPLSSARLGRELAHRGIKRGGSGRRYYLGVSGSDG